MARRQFGNIERMRSGRYRATYKHEGARLSAPTTFATKQDANLFLAGIQKDLSDGTWKRKDEGNQPFAPFALQWLNSRQDTIKRTTFEDYESIVKRHLIPKWGAYKLNAIKLMEFQNWLNDCKSGQALKIKSSMNQIMVEAVRNEIIQTNPIEYIKVKRTSKYQPNILTMEQLIALFEAIPTRYRLFVATLGLMGLRFGEACALRANKVEGNHLLISESVTKVRGGHAWTGTKTHETRQVSMPQTYKTELLAHIKERGLAGDELLFTTELGNLIDNRNFHKRVWRPTIDRLMEQGVLDKYIEPKDLRATNASIVADAFSILEASRRLGHASSNITTKHYARPIAGRDNQVANHLDDLMSKQPSLALAQ